jgi:dimethylglycine catabolism A
MVPWRATADGDVTEALLAWYARYAEGRPGAIVVEATGIRDIPSGPLLRIGHDRFNEGLKRLVDVVKDASGGETKLFIQIIDFLAIKRRPDPSRYFRQFLKITDAHRSALGMIGASEDDVRSALIDRMTERRNDRSRELGTVSDLLTERELSDLEFGYRERVTDMHLPHIRSLPLVLPELFASAARRAEVCGFDGVELHFAHAYTMASFLSRLNDRDDGYGGSPENRVKLPLEVFAAARSALSNETVLGCRFLADEVIEGGSRVEDASYYAVRFAEAGMDYLSLSKGGKFEDAKQPRLGEAAYPYTGESGHECMPTIYSDERGPLGRNLPLSRAIRCAVRDAGYATPIVAAGAINTFDLAERALQDGDCDIVAAARQSLADPDWWMKMRLGQGDAIRCCALTNYCEGLDQRHKQVTCRLWDRELEEGAMLADDGKRRLVAPPWRA